MRTAWHARWGADRSAGYVTAEAAVVIPALALLVVVLLWGLMAAVLRIQCVDAARAGARAAARGEPVSKVESAVRSAAPGARTQVAREGELVRVVVRARTAGPGPLTLELESAAVALDERGAGDGGEVEVEDESEAVAREGP
ncbi:pilus assembly protein [Streptomyces sp. NBC_01795]|nr:pilus assembly protein [Streptomyces sp. NBC_01795]WSB77658.1 pilus assembly protein [Streptomyces sp. NBC_01775]WSS14092.1 pilus assembly protein [Streptomyces sp. NBC_01186]WSS42932.1 pilus assembly protein [Streptomyces sp. NBC_01187]